MKNLVIILMSLVSTSAFAGDRMGAVQDQINQLQSQMNGLNEKLKTTTELNQQLAADYTYAQLKDWGASIGIHVTLAASTHTPTTEEIRTMIPYVKECVTRFRAYYGPKAKILTEVELRSGAYDVPFQVYLIDGIGMMNFNYWTSPNLDTCFNLLASTLIK